MVNNRRGGASRRGHLFARVAPWLLLAGVAWNVVFDRHVRAAERRYVDLHARREATTIREVMAPAIRGGAIAATAWALGVAGAGAAGDVLVRQRLRRRKRAGAANVTDGG